MDTYLLVDHFNGHKTLEQFSSADDAIAAAQTRTINPDCYLTVWKLTPNGTAAGFEADIDPDGNVRRN